jgi:hypothetical protein
MVSKNNRNVKGVKREQYSSPSTALGIKVVVINIKKEIVILNVHGESIEP